MQSIRKTFAWLSVVSLSTASLSGSATWAAPQEHGPCTETHIIEQWCETPYWVNVERGKPFIAERVVKSNSRSHSLQQTELVARDNAGRIRLESHSQSERVSSHRDVNTIMALGDDAGELAVSIHDCFSGKAIQLTPNTQTAIVTQSCADLPMFKQNDEPYSHKHNRFFGGKVFPDVLAVDLGDREIEGVKAHGVRLTQLGTEKLPIRVFEEWMSDDLGATVLWVDSNLLKQTEVRISLTDIRRVEPDSALFQIPSGYKVKVTDWK